MQLQESLADFEQSGLGVIAITYDAPQKQQPFIDKFNIQYPISNPVRYRSHDG